MAVNEITVSHPFTLITHTFPNKSKYVIPLERSLLTDPKMGSDYNSDTLIPNTSNSDPSTQPKATSQLGCYDLWTEHDQKKNLKSILFTYW